MAEAVSEGVRWCIGLICAYFFMATVRHAWEAHVSTAAGTPGALSALQEQIVPLIVLLVCAVNLPAFTKEVIEWITGFGSDANTARIAWQEAISLILTLFISTASGIAAWGVARASLSGQTAAGFGRPHAMSDSMVRLVTVLVSLIVVGLSGTFAQGVILLLAPQ